MEFMVANFPTIKLIIWALLLGGVIYTWLNGHDKTAAVLTVIAVGLFFLKPIKYDGTNSRENHIKTHKERTAEYNDVISVKQVVETSKPSFAERMAAENARSLQANEATLNDVGIKAEQEVTLEPITAEPITVPGGPNELRY